MDMKSKLIQIYNILRGFFPSPLPQGIPAFQSWADSIIETYSLPTEHRDSILGALATMIMHCKPTEGYKSKFYFVLCIKAGAAKQVAGAVFQDIKLKQQAAAQAEATEKSVASDVQNP